MWAVGKHLGEPRYSPLEMHLGLDHARGVYDWIAASRGDVQRRNGTIQLSQGSTLLHREFFNALIAEISLPALDARNVQTGLIKLVAQPELVRESTTKGNVRTLQPKADRNWMTNGFRLSIGGLSCGRVERVEALTLQTAVTTNDVGMRREHVLEPGKIELPDLVVTVPEADADSWRKWHKEFVIDGKRGNQYEKKATLELLNPRGRVLATLTFNGVGIYRLAPTPRDTAAQQVAAVTASMYCQDLVFDFTV
jgi:hypothetical protein